MLIVFAVFVLLETSTMQHYEQIEHGTEIPRADDMKDLSDVH
jgi:hypothetical protein